MVVVRSSIVLAAIFVLWACSANAQSFVWSESDAQQLSDRVSSGQYGQITSLWIEQNGDVIYDEYFNEAGQDTLHNITTRKRSLGW